MEIESLKQAALAELNAAQDLKALEQAKVDYLGSHGKFTALLKSLGNLPKEERPAAGKWINVAKVELETVLASRREELELKAAMPKQATDFTLPGRRRTVGKLHPLTQVTEDIVAPFAKLALWSPTDPKLKTSGTVSTPSTRRRTIRPATRRIRFTLRRQVRRGELRRARPEHRALHRQNVSFSEPTPPPSRSA